MRLSRSIVLKWSRFAIIFEAVKFLLLIVLQCSLAIVGIICVSVISLKSVGFSEFSTFNSSSLILLVVPFSVFS